MSPRITKGNLQIDQKFYNLIVDKIVPGTHIDTDEFWHSFEKILDQFMPKNSHLLKRRDDLQEQINQWHIQHKGRADSVKEYKQFLKNIGYISTFNIPDFKLNTKNIDPEISTIAGPQLVVPINNARFALNATNARWGSLFDAFYGTDIIVDEGSLAKKKQYNPTRGKKVIELANDFLDIALPLSKGKHKQVSAYSLIHNKSTKQKEVQIYLNNGHISELKHKAAFCGYIDKDSTCTLLFKNDGLYFEIQIDPCSVTGKSSLAGVKDVVLESGITVIQDCEDSVTAVDAQDKIQVYKNWLGLIKGDLKHKFEKNGTSYTRKLNPDREYLDTKGDSFSLSGRALLLIRNVGLLMTTDVVLYHQQEIPEGILDSIISALVFIHDFNDNGQYKNSAAKSLYIVKPKMHGPEEVKFTVDLFSRIEELLGLPENTLKIGIMDEERRTTVNLKACIYEARDRLIFINTGFLDRTGDEIHTSMEAGAFLPKHELKEQVWINAYEDWNVDIGLECGLKGKAQIGKGMWAMPDQMADMVTQKINHPLAGANCAWVPSPTAATLHAMHYHQVDVKKVQKDIANRQHAKLDDILTIPLMPSDYVLNEDQIIAELNDNAQSILGYVVRWIDQGVGCSKVPDTHNIGLMEDRATLRISSQILANWMHHNICTEQQITDAFKRMAILVDKQNSHDPLYYAMSPDYNGIAFKTALDLVLKGREQANGYTEPLLHHNRKNKKHEQD